MVKVYKAKPKRAIYCKYKKKQFSNLQTQVS